MENKQKEIISQNDKRWDLPHDDADKYIKNYIDELKGALIIPINPTENNSEWYENQRMGGLSVFGGLRSEFHYRLSNINDFEFEDLQSFDDKDMLIENAIEIANEALLSRDIEVLFEMLSTLISVNDNYDIELPSDSNVENWSELLNDLSLSQSDDSNNESEDKISLSVIDAINDLSWRLCELIAKNSASLNEIEWRHLEYVIAAALSGLGFNIELTPSSKDGGKDVIAKCLVKGKTKIYYIEIKHWRSGKKVNASFIFDFIEVNLTDSTDGGLFISSSGFGDPVYSCLCEIYKENIRLSNKNKIVSLCQRFVRRRRGLWEPIEDLSKILFEDTISLK